MNIKLFGLSYNSEYGIGTIDAGMAEVGDAQVWANTALREAYDGGDKRFAKSGIIATPLAVDQDTIVFGVFCPTCDVTPNINWQTFTTDHNTLEPIVQQAQQHMMTIAGAFRQR